MTSSGKFAQYCIPMLIEKLESDIPSARLAAMDVFVSILTLTLSVLAILIFRSIRLKNTMLATSLRI